MPGFQDLAVRLAELLDIPESKALAFVDRAIPVFVVESVVGFPTTRVPGLVGALCIGRGLVGALAANFSHAQIFNPARSGVVIHVDGLVSDAGVGGGMGLKSHDTELANLVTTKGYRDRRRRGSPVAEMRTEQNVATLGDVLADWQQESSVSFQWLSPLDIILDEGQGILVVPSAVNRSAVISWLWREV